jgi:membrane fusion protein
MQLHKGQHVSSQTPLLSVLPQHSRLQGELLVPSHAIGFIQPGQGVALKYAAFPFQKFGVYQGEVVEISKNVLIPNEWQYLPLHISQPSYRVTVQIDSQQVQAYGKSFSLQPGIQFDAHIRLDERSLLEWLLEPLLSLKGRFV